MNCVKTIAANTIIVLGVCVGLSLCLIADVAGLVRRVFKRGAV